jgi:hypothetical protein
MKLFLIAATAVALVSASAAHAQNSWPFAAKAMPLRGFLACTDPDNRPFTINYDLTTGRATLTDTAGPLEYIVTMDAADVLHLTHDKTPLGPVDDTITPDGVFAVHFANLPQTPTPNTLSHCIWR